MSPQKGRDNRTLLLQLVTAIAIVLVAAMLYGAGLFRSDGRWLTLEELDHIG